ncbi:hypothetical protein TGAM01_v203186 [Trichoderma gamsii]|uniref:FAD-binding PCMH-type domain-containing protein n=1 Tax=Trichoderma gamsii TaxID=398673 RepID=A0A2P4ZUT8_9HYPO|nr:hypothetical protein TGAM01_v203186 [Trichoderma gamsii]PON28049.1 hypothetical protein TGAM01_v203186 [Trichoderma gamsii]
MADSFKSTSLLTSPFSIPDPNLPATKTLSRWSDTLINSPPAIIITPNTEQDIVSAIKFAHLNNLTIIPAGGRHNAAVPITSNTLYLDLANLKSIQLDKQASHVHIGGGALTGDVMRYLAQEGYFTAMANSNAVGVVGCLLGGGNCSQNGLIGWMADNVVSFRVVTASGDILDISSSSKGEELALFNALCGTGHGLCVVVSATMKAYPLSSLNLSPASKDDPSPSIWSRTLIFPPTVIDAAIDAFLAASPPPDPMNVIFGFSRGPPGTPFAGKPIVLLTSTYYGPASEAEASSVGKILFNPSLVEKAVKADTMQVPFANANNAFDPMNVHGGFKSMSSNRFARLSPQALKDAYGKYLAVTDKYPDAVRSALMFHSFNPSKMAEIGATPEGKARFVEARDRGFCTIGVMWSTEPATRDALAALYDEAVAVLQKDDEEAGLPRRVFPGIMKFLPGRRDLLSEEKLAELDRLQEKWNGDGLFWSPYKV